MKKSTLLPLLGIVVLFGTLLAWPKMNNNSKPAEQFVPMSATTPHQKTAELKQKETKNTKPIPVKFGLKASFVKPEATNNK